MFHPPPRRPCFFFPHPLLVAPHLSPPRARGSLPRRCPLARRRAPSDPRLTPRQHLLQNTLAPFNDSSPSRIPSAGPGGRDATFLRIVMTRDPQRVYVLRIALTRGSPDRAAIPASSATALTLAGTITAPGPGNGLSLPPAPRVWEVEFCRGGGFQEGPRDDDDAMGSQVRKAGKDDRWKLAGRWEFGFESV